MSGALKKLDFSKRETLYKVVGLAALFTLFLVMPFFLSNRQLVMFARIFILAVYGMSYDLLRGYTGFINLGQAIFFGSGAYMGVILLNANPSVVFFLLAIVIMTLYGLLGGFIISRIVLRTQTVVASAMVTLALGEIVRQIAERWRDVTGGQDGLPMGNRQVAFDGIIESAMQAINSDISNRGIRSAQNIFHYFLAFVFLLVMIAVLRLFVLSPTGRVMLAIRENEQRARFLGYTTANYKTIALMVSSVAAGYAGVFFSIIVRFANTDYLSVQYTLNALVITLVGGTGTLYGAIIGSGFITILQTVLNDLNRALSFELLKYPMLFIGTVYILLVIFLPSGIMGGIYKLADRYALWKEKKSE